MRAEDVRQHVRRQPFRPFRVFISDGATYDVRHPEMVLVSRTEIVFAIGVNGGMPEAIAFCDPVHITRIELLSEQPDHKPH